MPDHQSFSFLQYFSVGISLFPTEHSEKGLLRFKQKTGFRQKHSKNADFAVFRGIRGFDTSHKDALAIVC
jgi:hypothetical protein